jgi:hypothetical protein
MKSIIVNTIAVGIDGKNLGNTEYSVNDRGQGLWCNGKQIIGTCDFSADTPAELMRKLKSDTNQTMEKMTMVRGSANGWD